MPRWLPAQIKGLYAKLTSRDTSLRHHSAPLLTIIGLIAGLAATFYRINKTASPVDMVIYRQGVDAFLHGREM